MEYEKRIKKNIPFERIEIPDLKGRGKMSELEIKKREGELIKKNLPKSPHLILLDNNGREYDSKSFAAFVQSKMSQSTKDLVFVVGGAYGFSDEIYQMAIAKLSLSKMTFSHQIIRVIFLEQLYRAFSILNNDPYHHE